MAYGASYEYTTADTVQQIRTCNYFALMKLQHLLKWQPFWKTTSDWHIIFILFGFFDPENIDIDTNINFLSPLFARIWDMENSHRPFWKWLSQPQHTNIITIFGLCGPDINDKDTTNNFLSILFAEIWDIDNSWRPFWKWLPQPPRINIIATFGFLDSENIDIETIINFLCILFAEIWDIENSWRPFWKMAATDPTHQYIYHI